MIRSFLCAVAIVVAGVAVAADEVIVEATPSAQEHAEVIASTGVIRHCRVRGVIREGIGFSPAGPEEAVKSSCFYQDFVRGRYKIVERGVAYSPSRRGWYAVVRYR